MAGKRSRHSRTGWTASTTPTTACTRLARASGPPLADGFGGSREAGLGSRSRRLMSAAGTASAPLSVTGMAGDLQLWGTFIRPSATRRVSRPASDLYGKVLRRRRARGAPVVMDDPVARRFLEQSQYLGGVMGGTLPAVDRSADGAPGSDTGIDDAMRQMQVAAAPLLRQLSPAIRDSVQRIGQTAEE